MFRSAPILHAWFQLILTLVLCTHSSAQSNPNSPFATSSGIEFFETRIRPVLAQDCYECHRTGKKVRGGLALDHRQALLAGGDSGPALVPGNPDASLLLQVIRHDVPDLAMPRNGAQLEASVLRDFEQWIRMGAPDPRDSPPSDSSVESDTDWPAVLTRRKQWWSFQPITDPPIPTPNTSTPSSHPIDRFIQARLATANLSPAPRADAHVLHRRLSFALLGLPPEPGGLPNPAAQPDSNSHARSVDSLLASPNFGERWARHWMDWVRYADSHGSEGDADIPNAWQYRDYLIRALNADVPYDQLVREHLAGDLLKNPRLNSSLGLNESAIGPAHLRMVLHGFAPTDALEELVRFTDDQINVVSKAFLGLTVSCARCHHHKFDPISQHDFYGWYGILASCVPAQVAINAPDPAQDQIRTQLASLRDSIREKLTVTWSLAALALPQRLAHPDPTLKQAIAKADHPGALLHPFHLLNPSPESASNSVTPLNPWLKRTAPGPTPPKPLQAWDLTHPDHSSSWISDGPGVGHLRPAGFFQIASDGDSIVAALHPAARISQADSSRDRGVLISPGIQLNGRHDLWLRIAGDGGALARFVVQNYPRDGTVYPVQRLSGGQWRWMKFGLEYWDGDRIHVEITTAADQPVLTDVNAVRSWFAISQVQILPEGSPPPAEPVGWIELLIHATGNTNTTDAQHLADAFAQAGLQAVEAWKTGALTDSQAGLLDQFFRSGLLPNQISSLPDLAPLVAQYRSLEASLKTPNRAPGVLETLPANAPLLVRGDHRQPADPVPRHFLDAIDDTPYPAIDSGRLRLAEDILRPDNPLTARVIVNRIWTHLFGRGLVATPDNFGRMGQPPTHPELLDHLATRFVRDGWSIQRLIRYIVTSETWCASSQPSPDALQQDPANLLLSHFPVRRLEAEAIRDSLLHVSGQLQSEIRSGPPVNGRTPRRSVFLRVKRNDLDPLLASFDAPAPSSTTGARDVTNVPGQALTLLNDPFILELAGHWAKSMLADLSLSNAPARIQSMFLRAFARPPSDVELDRSETFLKTTRQLREQRQASQTSIESRIKALRDSSDSLLAEAGRRLVQQGTVKQTTPPRALPEPWAAWEFTDDLSDQTSRLKAHTVGKARVEAGALVLDGRTAALISEPINITLRAKTLEAWVQLDNLQQQGGGVITVQTLDGGVFDSLVFGEQQPGHWLSGSDFFRRTQGFKGTIETEAATSPVHLAVVYAPDGRITAYRNGKPYGSSYQSDGPATFEAGKAQILVGNRHGDPGGNRLLAGRIHAARLYDRALDPKDIAALASDPSRPVSQADRLAALTPAERARWDEAQATLQRLMEEIATLQRQNALPDEWADLAHAYFNLKEFIFIR
jgi:hypothetical protein